MAARGGSYSSQQPRLYHDEIIRTLLLTVAGVGGELVICTTFPYYGHRTWAVSLTGKTPNKFSVLKNVI